MLPDELSPSSAHSSNSQSLPDDDSFRMYNNIDRGHIAAVLMHGPEADDDGLPTHDPPETRSSSMPEPLAPLLRKSLVTYGGPQSGSSLKWLPVDRLFQYVTVKQVFHELTCALDLRRSPAKVCQTQITSWAQEICRQQKYINGDGKDCVVSCRGLFAILCLIGLVKDAPVFVDAGLTDMHLPLGHDYEEKSRLYILCSYVDRSKQFSVPVQWGEPQLDLFGQYQTYILSPFFELKGNEVPFYDLHPKLVLPFIEEHSKLRRQAGLHGTVYRVKIHAAHHDLHEVELPPPPRKSSYMFSPPN